jgi:small subunit ribosomal protein S20
MPQHKGAVRRVRLSEKRKSANKGQKVALRKMMKEFTGAETAEGVQKLQSSLDKLAKKGLIHKNYAANKKSQIARAAAKAKTAA